MASHQTTTCPGDSHSDKIHGTYCTGTSSTKLMKYNIQYVLFLANVNVWCFKYILYDFQPVQGRYYRYWKY